MSEQTQHTDAQGGHLIPVSTYLKVWGALILLTVITVAASRIDFGGWNLVIAMIIATTKAILVALVFMHLLYDNKLYASFFAGALVFLGIFIVLTMFDTLDRGDLHAEEKNPIHARAEIYGDDGKPLKKNSHEEGAETDTRTGKAAADSASVPETGG